MQSDWAEDVEKLDRLVADLIGAATLAGAYATLTRQMPEAAGGFAKLAVKQKARVAALAQEINASAARLVTGQALAAVAPLTQ